SPSARYVGASSGLTIEGSPPNCSASSNSVMPTRGAPRDTRYFPNDQRAIGSRGRACTAEEQSDSARWSAPTFNSESARVVCAREDASGNPTATIASEVTTHLDHGEFPP